MLSPQLLIPPHSVQAEASGGTVNHETSKGSPTKLYGLCASLDPVQEQPQNVDRSVHIPIPQYTSTGCVETQSHTVAVGSAISAPSLCRQTTFGTFTYNTLYVLATHMLKAMLYCFWKSCAVYQTLACTYYSTPQY